MGPLAERAKISGGRVLFDRSSLAYQGRQDFRVFDGKFFFEEAKSIVAGRNRLGMTAGGAEGKNLQLVQGDDMVTILEQAEEALHQ